MSRPRPAWLKICLPAEIFMFPSHEWQDFNPGLILIAVTAPDLLTLQTCHLVPVKVQVCSVDVPVIAWTTSSFLV